MIQWSGVLEHNVHVVHGYRIGDPVWVPDLCGHRPCLPGIIAGPARAGRRVTHVRVILYRTDEGLIPGSTQYRSHSEDVPYAPLSERNPSIDPVEHADYSATAHAVARHIRRRRLSLRRQS